MRYYDIDMQEDGQDSTQDDGQITNTNDQQEPDEDKIVIPDVSKLNVNTVAKAEHEIQSEMDSELTPMQQEITDDSKRTIALTDAVEETDELVQAVEHMVVAMKFEGQLPESTAQLANLRLKKIRKDHRLKVAYKYSTEAFGSMVSRPKQSAYVLEGFVDTVREMWAAVMRVLSKAVDWVKNFIKKYFFTVKADIEKIKDTMGEIEAIRSKIPNGKEPIDKDHWINSMQLFMPLSIAGAISATDMSHFNNLLSLSSFHEKLDKIFTDTWLGLFEKNIKQLKENNVPVPSERITMMLDGFMLTGPGMLLSNSPQTLLDSVSEDKAPAGYGWLKTITMPGDIYVAYLISDKFGNKQNWTMAPYDEIMEAMGNWKIKIVHNQQLTAASGWFPFFTTEQLRQRSEVMIKVGRALETMEKNSDVFDKIGKRLKSIMEQAQEFALELANNKQLDMIGTEKLKYMNKMVAALNAFIVNMNVATSEFSKYLKQTMMAWNYFLQLVKQEDIKMADLR